MKEKFAHTKLLGDYEICGMGAAPEEDDLVVLSDEAIRKLRGKPSFFERLFSGPYEISGTGINPDESDFVIQELVKH
jgi:hypothetical protein